MTSGWMPGAERINGVYRFTGGGEPKVGFCDHAAGGFLNTMRDPGFWNDQVKCSVHFATGRDGRKVQLVNIFDRAWGQGRLGPRVIWPGYPAMAQRNPNEYLISIEHEDWTFENRIARAVPGSQWTEAEYQATLEIKAWCREEFLRVKGVDIFPFGIDSLASHHMFDGVNRVNCAGQFWRNEYQLRQWQDLSRGVILDPEEDEMKSHYAWAVWFEGRQIDAGPSFYRAQLRSDFQLPDDAKAVVLQNVLGAGAVEWFHANSQTPALRYGDGWLINLDADGAASFRIQAPTTFRRLQCVGYFR